MTDGKVVDGWGRLVLVSTALSAAAHVTLGVLVFGGVMQGLSSSPPIERVYTVELTDGARPGGVSSPSRLRKPAPAPKKRIASVSPAIPKPAVPPTAPPPVAKPKPKPKPKPPVAKPKVAAPKATSPVPPPPKARKTAAPKKAPAATTKKPELPKAPAKKAEPPPAATSTDTPSAAGAKPAAPDDDYASAAARWKQRAVAGGGAGQVGPRGTGGGDGGGGTLVGAEFLGYLELVTNTMKARWVSAVDDPTLVATVRFQISRDGTVSDARIAKPSGHGAYDQAALRAVQSMRRLPKPPPKYADDFRDFQIVFRQDGAGGSGE